MTVLLMSARKAIAQSSPEEWVQAGSRGVVLVTAAGGDDATFRERYADAFAAVETFRDYDNSELVVVRARALALERSVRSVLAFSEVDVLRSAVIRERLGLDGMRRAEALLFRHKPSMKAAVAAGGYAVAAHQVLRDGCDLTDFIVEHGFPVVVKPVAGRGSARTQVLAGVGDVDAFLQAGRIRSAGGVPQMMVEAFVEGDLYRVDGLYADGAPVTMVTSRYIGGHLEFLGGLHLGSVTFSRGSELGRELERVVRAILERVLPFGAEGLFHAEVFVRPSGEIVFNEVGARLGGGGIGERTRITHGVDIKLEAVRRAVGAAGAVAAPSSPCAAGLAISPRRGHLVRIPTACDHPWVRTYEHKPPGSIYDLMSHTNDEVARFLLVGEDEQQAEARLQTVLRWFENRVRWDLDAAG